MRSLSRLLAPERVVWLAGESRNEILRELAEVHCRIDPTVPLDQVLAALVEREELGSTAIGLGLALPHARIDKLRSSRSSRNRWPTLTSGLADERTLVVRLGLRVRSEDFAGANDWRMRSFQTKSTSFNYYYSSN